MSPQCFYFTWIFWYTCSRWARRASLFSCSNSCSAASAARSSAGESADPSPLLNKWINRRVNESVSECISELVNHLLKEKRKKKRFKRKNEWINDCMNKQRELNLEIVKKNTGNYTNWTWTELSCDFKKFPCGTVSIVSTNQPTYHLPWRVGNLSKLYI